MKAIVITEHGGPDVLTLMDVDTPVPKDQQVVIKVRAASINPVDWHMMRAEPPFLKRMAKSSNGILGFDVAGDVAQVGAKVTQFRPGDAVFGSARGACAEYACASEGKLVPKPARLTYEQAAAIPVAGFTAVQAVRDFGRVQPGQRVLINGAAGGVGTFAVQVAKALGGEVTGVCSRRNLEFLQSIGADDTIDYAVHDFWTMGRHYDVIVQVAGNPTKDELRRALAPDGRAVLVGGGTGRTEGEKIRMMEILGDLAGNLLAPLRRQKIYLCIAKGRTSDLAFISELVDTGKLTPVVDRTYPLADTAEAIRYLEAGHARGKVVITP